VSFGGTAASVSPAALAFGNVALSTTSPFQTVVLSNNGNTTLTYSLSFLGTNLADFAVLSNPCGATVAANSTCAIGVTFTPTLGALESASLIITTSDPANPLLTVSLSGTGGALPLLTITPNNTTMRYGSSVPALTVSYNPGNPAGLTTLPICSTTATKTSPVGMYPITCTGAVDATYAITYVAGTVSITPAPLTIWASNGAMTFGGTPPTITPSYVGLVAGDTPAIFTPPTTPPIVAPVCTTTAVVGSAIGNYQSTCSGAADPNYTISYAPGVVTVRKAALTITSNASRVYGTANPSPLPLTGTGLVPPDTLASLNLAVVCSTTATTASPVGSYPITCTGPASTTNYNITYPPGTLTVTPAPASVTPSAASKVYGTADPVPLTTGTLTGFLAADNVTATYSRTAGESVAGSPYTISATLSPAAVLTNYTITYNTASFTITPAVASVTPNPATKVYGTADPAPLTTGTLTGFTPADRALITPTFTRAPGANVGTYLISATLAPANVIANYTVTYNTANFTITPAALKLTANNAAKVYGAPLPVFSVTGTGFANGDTVGSLSGTLSCITSATPTSPVGSYPLNCSGLTSTNYTITYAPGTLTVTPATLTITAPNASRIWGFANPVFTPTATGLVTPPDTLASLGVSCVSPATATSAVGSYAITCSGVTSANYTVGYVAGTLTVTTAVQLTPVSLTFATQNIGTTSPAQTATLTNIGGSTMTFGIAITGDFLRNGGGGSCGTTLAAGATCAINVRFRPIATGLRTGTLTVTSALAGSGAVALSGTGNGATAAVTPTTNNFGGVTRGQVSAPFNFTVTNTGTSALTFNATGAFTLGGSNPNQFVLTTGGSCANGQTLAALGSCTFSVTFAPRTGTALGNKSAIVRVRSNATNGTQSVTVVGTAQ